MPAASKNPGSTSARSAMKAPWLVGGSNPPTLKSLDLWLSGFRCRLLMAPTASTPGRARKRRGARTATSQAVVSRLIAKLETWLSAHVIDRPRAGQLPEDAGSYAALREDSRPDRPRLPTVVSLKTTTVRGGFRES